jgi:hypothetical protein
MKDINKTFLSTNEIKEVGKIITDCLVKILNDLTEVEKKHVVMFVLSILKEERPYVIAGTKAGLEHIYKIVFGNREKYSFLFRLQFEFFSQWGNENEDIDALVNTMARSITFNRIPIGGVTSVINNDLIAIPKEIFTERCSYEDAAQLLSVNHWLLIILLIQAHVRDIDTGEK